jgi:hypothetical protein
MSELQEIELARGIWVGQLDAGAILSVRVATIERSAIDCLYRWLVERMMGWDERVLWLALYDLTPREAMLTLHMRRRMDEFARLRPEVPGRVAFVMRRDTATALFELFRARQQPYPRTMRVWHSHQEALAWLRELL